MDNKKNIKKIRERFAPYLVALIIGTSFLGCTTTQVVNRSKPTLEKAAEVLGVSKMMVDENLPNGYKTSIFVKDLLTTLAGIYAGTIKVGKLPYGHVTHGSYSEFDNPDALIRVLREADTKPDGIITTEEANNLAKKIYEEYTK